MVVECIHPTPWLYLPLLFNILQPRTQTEGAALKSNMSSLLPERQPESIDSVFDAVKAACIYPRIFGARQYDAIPRRSSNFRATGWSRTHWLRKG